MQVHPDDALLMDRYARMQERFEWLGGYEYESMSRKIVQGLGFSEADMDRPVQRFSGGQKTRINLAKALVRRPDYLFWMNRRTISMWICWNGLNHTFYRMVAVSSSCLMTGISWIALQQAFSK